MWYNGRPAGTILPVYIYYYYHYIFVEEPVRLSLATDTPTPLTVNQGQTFSLTINCVNDIGDIINGIHELYPSPSLYPLSPSLSSLSLISLVPSHK